MLAAHVSTGRPLRLRLAYAVAAIALGLAGIGVAAPAATAVEDPANVQIAVIAPIVTPASDTGILSIEKLTQYTLPLGLLSRQLDAAINRPVTIAVDPMIIVSMRLLGTSAPTAVTNWLTRLQDATNEVIPLPFSDSDVTLATQAGSALVVTPQPFDFAIDPSLFQPAPDATATPTPTATATPSPDAAPTLPTSDELSQWDYAIADLLWPRENSVISADLAAFSASGYTTTLLSSSNVVRDSPRSPVATIDGASVLVTDAAVSAGMQAAASAASSEVWQSAIGELSTTVAAAGLGSTLIASFDRTVPFMGSRIGETLATLQATPGVTLVPLSVAAESTAGTATLVDAPQDAARVATVAGMLSDLGAEAQFATILANPEHLTAERTLSLLALLNIAWGPDVAGWSAATDTFQATSVEIRNSVKIVVSSDINFYADRASIPISVVNDLAHAVTVYITVRPETALISVQDSWVKLSIEPNSQAKGQVPIEALSNGVVEVVTSLSSETGVAIDSQFAKINVQAGWETPIVLILATIVVLIFGLGIARNILRRRRSSAVETDEDADAETDADEESPRV